MNRMIAKTILCLVMGLVYGIAQAQRSAEVQSALNQRMRLIEDKISSEQIAEGYYIIVGVYSHYKGACTKMKRIQQLGIKAAVFTHPENQMSYTYIEKAFDTRGRAGEMLLKLLRLPEFSEAKLWVLKVGSKLAK